MMSAGMRPRSETSWPLVRAQSRIALVSLDGVLAVLLRAVLVLLPVTRWPASMYGATAARNVSAFSSLRSMDYSLPSKANDGVGFVA